MTALTDHAVLMAVFALHVAAFLGTLWRDTPRERARLAARLFAALFGGGLAIAWLLFLVQR